MRPIQKVLTFATANVAGIAASQTPALATTAVSLAQTPALNANLTIAGTLATGGVATFPVANKLTLTSTSDFSATNFSITGTNGAGSPQTETLAGPNNNTVSSTKSWLTISSIGTNATGYTTETVSAGADHLAVVTVNGTYATAGVATLPTPAPVTIKSTSNLAAFAFYIRGTNAAGATVTDTITGPNNGTTTGVVVFKTITKVSTNAYALTVEAVQVGEISEGDTGATAWWPLDIYVPNQVTTISVNILSGTATYSVEYTNEDPFDTSITPLAVAHPVGAFTGASTSLTEFTTTLMRAVRINVTGGTGSVRVTVVQQSTQ